jgi:hypothetical protein
MIKDRNDKRTEMIKDKKDESIKRMKGNKGRKRSKGCRAHK